MPYENIIVILTSLPACIPCPSAPPLPTQYPLFRPSLPPYHPNQVPSPHHDPGWEDFHYPFSIHVQTSSYAMNPALPAICTRNVTPTGKSLVQPHTSPASPCFSDCEDGAHWIREAGGTRREVSGFMRTQNSLLSPTLPCPLPHSSLFLLHSLPHFPLSHSLPNSPLFSHPFTHSPLPPTSLPHSPLSSTSPSPFSSSSQPLLIFLFYIPIISFSGMQKHQIDV